MKIDDALVAASQALDELHRQQMSDVNKLLTQVAIAHRQVAQATASLRHVFSADPQPTELGTQPVEAVDDVLTDMLGAPPPDPHDARIERLAREIETARQRLSPPPLPARSRG